MTRFEPARAAKAQDENQTECRTGLRFSNESSVVLTGQDEKFLVEIMDGILAGIQQNDASALTTVLMRFGEGEAK